MEYHVVTVLALQELFFHFLGDWEVHCVAEKEQSGVLQLETGPAEILQKCFQTWKGQFVRTSAYISAEDLAT